MRLLVAIECLVIGAGFLVLTGMWTLVTLQANYTILLPQEVGGTEIYWPYNMSALAYMFWDLVLLAPALGFLTVGALMLRREPRSFTPLVEEPDDLL